MITQKYVQEDKVWSGDAGENAQYQRIARAWNGIHATLLSNPNAACTTPLEFSEVFFITCGELLLCENFSEKYLVDGIDRNSVLSLNDIEGQSDEDLKAMADTMESWLDNPTFIDKGPDVNLVPSALLAEIDSEFWRQFEDLYLTTEPPASFLSRYVRTVYDIDRPDSLDFRA